MRQLDMPKPQQFYNDVDAYLTEVLESSDASNDARMYAGIALGTLVSQRSVGPRLEAFLTTIALEDALTGLQIDAHHDGA